MSSIFKRLQPADFLVTPFDAYKTWRLTSANASSSFDTYAFYGTYQTGSEITYIIKGQPVLTYPKTINGKYQGCIHASMNSAFYERWESEPFSTLGPFFIEEERRMSKYIHVLQIPQLNMGQKIKAGSVFLTSSQTPALNLHDDSRGNLYDANLLASMSESIDDSYYLMGEWTYEQHHKPKLDTVPTTQDPDIWNIKDYSKYENEATYTGSVIFSTSQSLTPYAQFTSGSYNAVRIPHSQRYNFKDKQDFAISTFIKPSSSISTTQTIIAKAGLKKEYGVPGYNIDIKKSQPGLQTVLIDKIVTGSYPFDISLERPQTSSIGYPMSASQSGSYTSQPGTWTEIQRITGSQDGQTARVLGSLGGYISVDLIPNQLLVGNYGFNIPANATITGFEATIMRNVITASGANAGQNIRDEYVYLSKNTSSISEHSQGDNKADTSTEWPRVGKSASYGSSTDLWGQTWTATDVNQPEFGLQFCPTITGSYGVGIKAHADFIGLNVYWETDGLINCSRYDGSTVSTVSSSVTMSKTEFTHVLFQKTGSALQLYLDGVLDSTGTDASSRGTCNLSDVFIGAHGNGTKQYNGYQGLYSTRIYSKALSSEEAYTLYKTKYNSANVGNVFYNTGQITITNPIAAVGSSWTGSFPYWDTFRVGANDVDTYTGWTDPTNWAYNWSLQYNSTLTIYQNEILCTVPAGSFNLSFNPTLRDTSTEVIGCDIMSVDKLLGIVTHSTFNPYATSIGLYNDYGQLMAIAKTARPIQMIDNADMTFVVRFDVDVGMAGGVEDPPK